MHRKTGYTLILLTMLATVCSYIVVDPVPQDTRYHNFADQGMLLGIPNALNVLSNLPFVLVGLYGLVVISRIKHSPSKIVVSNWFAYWSLFAGVVLVGIGSAYYHLSPDNRCVVGDLLVVHRTCWCWRFTLIRRCAVFSSGYCANHLVVL